MAINHQHILGLMSDILKNQNIEQTLTIDEQNQVRELADQLLQQGITDEQLVTALTAIQQYNQTTNSSYPEEELSEWLQVIDQNIIT